MNSSKIYLKDGSIDLCLRFNKPKIVCGMFLSITATLSLVSLLPIYGSRQWGRGRGSRSQGRRDGKAWKCLSDCFNFLCRIQNRYLSLRLGENSVWNYEIMDYLSLEVKLHGSMKSPSEVHGLMLEVAPVSRLCVFLQPHSTARVQG